MFTDDDLNVFYYHGVILDDDTKKLLETPGDYLVQGRQESEDAVKIIVAIRQKTGDDGILRLPLSKTAKGIGLANQMFTSLDAAVMWLRKAPREVEKCVVVETKRPVPRDKWALRHSDVRMKEKIGYGAYGTVWRSLLTRKESEKIKVAVKKLDSQPNTNFLVEFMKEARVMQLYDHPNIVAFYGYVVDRMPYLLVMEFCDGGSVEDCLREHSAKPISKATRIDLAVQAATGIEYLHSKKCIHRDIAARNCLLKGKTLKVADFGMCRQKSAYKVDLGKPTNVRWLAPEVWVRSETNFATDVYAFGVFLWELFILPYDIPYAPWKARIVKKRVMEGYRMPAPPGMPPKLEQVMNNCWEKNPEKRPDMGDVREKLEQIEKTSSTDHTRSKSRYAQG